MGTAQTPLPIAAGTVNVTSGGAVFLSDSTAGVNVGASTAGSAFTLSDNGTITTTGLITATAITLKALAQSNGSIVLDANLGATADTETLQAAGSGGITGNTFTVSGGTVNLITAGGNIVGTSGVIPTKFLTTAAAVAINAVTGTALVQDSVAAKINSGNAGSFTFLDTTGSITTAGAITGTVVNLTAGGTSGGIALGASVGSTGGTTTLTGSGSGSITAANSSVNVLGSTVSLVSPTGSIGATTSAINTSAATLTAVAGGTGSVYVNNGASVQLGTSSAGATFMLTNTGNITTTGAVTAPTLTLEAASGSGGSIVLENAAGKAGGTTKLQADGSGTITGGSNLVLGSTVSLLAGSGTIGTSANGQLQTSASTLTITAGTSGSAFVNDTGAVKLNASSAGPVLDLTAGGTITVSGVVAASALTLQNNTGSGGGIVISANTGVTGGTTVLKSDGGGSISQTAGLVLGANLTLWSGFGNIGTSAQNIKTDVTGTITSTTSKSGTLFGTTFINNSSTTGVTLGSSQSGGTFSIVSSGPLTVNSIATQASTTTGSNGSITAVAASGKLLVNANAVIVATGGNITIQNNNVKTGTIEIGAGSQIYAWSTVANVGQVNVVIGAIPTTLVLGVTPANVRISRAPGGNVYFGANSITTNALTPYSIDVYPKGRNIIFSTGTELAKAIQLDDSVVITATTSPYTPIAYQSGLSEAMPISSGSMELLVDTGDIDFVEDDFPGSP